MWCRSCQQDVPGSSAEGSRGRMACPRCKSTLNEPESAAPRSGKFEQRQTNSDSDAGFAPIPMAPPFDERDWELEQELRSAERLLRSLGVNRIDRGHPPLPGSNAEQAFVEPARNQAEQHLVKPSVRSTSNSTSIGAWFLLATGLTSGVFGGVLLLWSWFATRPELWTFGLPFALGGQALLMLGLFVQLDYLWQNQRQATATIAEMDYELCELKKSTDEFGSSYGAQSQTFYSHMAEGASPHLLLADLKGQLDLLATKLRK